MKPKISLLAAAAAAFLSACGAGNDAPSSSTTKTSTQVSSDVAANVAALAATPISGLAANEVAYDFVASIGDTWRLIVNTSTNKARVKVLHTDHNLTDTTEVSVARTPSGSQELLVGTGIDVRVDTRTKNASGTLTVGAKKSSVTGTGYAANPLSDAVQGDYAFAGIVTCYSGANTSSPTCGKELSVGTLRVKSGGVLLVCEDALITTDTACTDPTTRNVVSVPAQGAVNAQGIITANSNPWGRLKVIPGDLGTVLMIDRAGSTNNGFSAGAFGARKLTALQGSEFNGDWSCTDGAGTKKYAVSGTSVTATSGASSNQASLAYNKLGIGNSPASMPSLNGLVATYSGSQGPFDAILPLSSSFVLVVHTETGSPTTLSVCGRE